MWIGSAIMPAHAAGDSRRNSLSVTAEVGRTCHVSSSAAAGLPRQAPSAGSHVNCASLSGWTATVSREAPATASGLRETAAAGPGQLTFVTLTY
jgi:hypothetical protein